MGRLRDLLARIFTPTPTPPSVTPRESSPETGAFTRERASEWLKALESGDLHPPRNVHDVDAWNRYWENHCKAGVIEQSFADMMSSDRELIGLARSRGASSILCAGNGLSQEAVALALAGFDVTQLDISPIPAAAMSGWLSDPEGKWRQIPGFSVQDDGSVSFGQASLAPKTLWPKIHCSDHHRCLDGGTLSFATGDLSDSSVCPGPYDVVIERRTVQLFPPEEQISAVECLVARLSETGLFVSQQHSGGWRPGQDRTHYAQAWLEARGFSMSFRGAQMADGVTRAARVWFTTG